MYTQIKVTKHRFTHLIVSVDSFSKPNKRPLWKTLNRTYKMCAKT